LAEVHESRLYNFQLCYRQELLFDKHDQRVRNRATHQHPAAIDRLSRSVVLQGED
jgi:hypothetical protein